MKKLLWIVMAALTAVWGGSPAIAQGISAYQLSGSTGAALHTFSQNATVFTFNEGTELNQLLLIPGKSNITLPQPEADPMMGGMPAAVEEGIAIGFDFPYGSRTMTHFGLTGAGYVFFSESQTLHPAVGPTMANMLVENYLHWALGYMDSYGIPYPGTIKAGADTKIQYETINDTLFIGYENLRVADMDNENNLSASWQYMLTPDGSVSMVVDNLQPQGASSIYYMEYGLAGDWNSEMFTGDYLYMMNPGWQDPQTSTFLFTNDFNAVLYPAPGSCYTFTTPPACEAVNDGIIYMWDAEASTNTINLNQNMAFAWGGSDAMLLILSEEAELSGDNLPEDGKTYTSLDQIGTSAGITTGTYSYGMASFNPPFFENLEQGTQYYMHAFLYNTTCSGGPVYGTPITEPIQTLLDAPESMTADNMTGSSLDLHITNNEKADGYLLVRAQNAFDEMSDNIFEPDGTQTYTDGQTLSINGNTITVIRANATDALVPLSGIATDNGICHFYSWALVESSDATTYSAEYASLSVMLPVNIPFTFEFEGQTSGSAPFGWSTSVPEQASYAFRVNAFSETPDEMFISAQISDGEASEGDVVWSDIITPTLLTGTYENATAYFDLRVYSQQSESIASYSMTEGDSILIQYATGNDAERSWTTFGKVDSETELTNGAFNTITAGTFPIIDVEELHIRIVAYHNQGAEGSSNPIYAIRNLTVEPVLSCLKVEDLAIMDGGLSYNAATLEWTDANPSSRGFLVRLQQQGESEWTSFPVVSEESFEIADLEAATVYTAQVTAICGAGDTSLATEIEFTTLRSLPYFAELKMDASWTMEVPEDLLSMEGSLADTGASILEGAATGWMSQDYGMGPVFGISNTSAAPDSWLVLPGLAVGKDQGSAQIDFRLMGKGREPNPDPWAYDDIDTDPEFGNDTLFVLLSEDGGFNRSHIIRTITSEELDSAYEYTRFSTEFDVYPNNYLALYFKGEGNVTPDFHNRLELDSLHVFWTDRIYYCPAVTNLRSMGRTDTSIDLAWEGESLEYAVVYMNRRDTVADYDTVWSETESCTLNGLVPGGSYAIHVIGFCGENRTGASDPSEILYINTQAPCLAPRNLQVLGTTLQSVRLGSESDAQNKEMHIWAQDLDRFPSVNYYIPYTYDTTTFEGLIVLLQAPYYAQARAICAPGDTSVWSDTVDFVTDPVPACGAPSDVDVDVNTDELTATLSWTPGQNNQATFVLYRASSSARYDTTGTGDNYFTIRNLRANTSYVYRLFGFCDDYLYSRDVDGEFSTTPQAIESVLGFKDALQVRVLNGQIIVNNPASLYLRDMEVYTTDGKLLNRYELNTNGNTFVYADYNEEVFVIRLIGEGDKQASFKVLAW